MAAMAQTASIEATSSPVLGTRARAVLMILLVGITFALSWYAVGRAFTEDARMDDTPLYLTYALEMRHGLVPYRDFSVEYPPGALAAFAVPSLISSSRTWQAYESSFGLTMAVCGLLLAALVFLMKPGGVPSRSSRSRLCSSGT